MSARTSSLAALLCVLVGIVAALIAASPEPARPAATPGQAIYQQYCVACHGASGRGDGPSAAAFATKPADLTDGRILNPLPDEFLARIIREGGPAEGLSPGMPAFGAFLGEDGVRNVIGYVRALAQPAFAAEKPKPIVRIEGAPMQPVFFSHLIHAGSFQIACQYCHADARRSDYAGLPSLDRCLGCHKIIGAVDNPEIGKLHRYRERGEAIPWVRVFKVPEYVYFPHKAHVRVGLECQRCHGPIEQMRVVGADTGRSLANDLVHLVSLGARQRPLTMGWCIECHRTENAKPDRRAPLDCATCHH